MKKIAVILTLCILLACCERRIDLGEGYQYIQLDGENWTVSDRDNIMIIYPNVVRCRVLGTYIVGERIESNIDKKFHDNLGFFIFDMKKQQLLEGMSKLDFETALRTRGFALAPF